MKLNCIVTAGTTNDKTGLFSPICEQKNLVMYEGADIIAGLLAGQPLQLSHMYFHYYNSGTVTAPALNRTMGRSWFYDSIPGSGNVNSTQDWLRVPIITTPKLFKSPSDSAYYNNNGIYLTATSAASTSKTGESSRNLAFSSDANSKVLAVALVSATDPSDYRKDKIFSRVNLGTAITVASGSQPTIFWSVQIS